MTLIEITEKNFPQSIKKASNLLVVGGVVVARADTSYALLLLPRFLKNHRILNRIKDNRRNKQYALFIDSKETLLKKVPEAYRKLVGKLVPGKVTIVAKQNESGLRYIESATVNSLIKAVKSPLTATSANPSGKEPARDRATIEKYFAESQVMVLYEGDVRKQSSSTIVDVSGEKIKILRQGSVRVTKKLLKASL